ncbi:MAG TPA: SDR family oxidoreductase [Jatrophihabitantaceae bacterium]|nr:SDR family oxidoreductase [Jatrophihabitantaceae bacterium]
MRARRSAVGLRVLVTGAASGIGRAVADQLGAAGALLYLTDLHQERLDEVVASITSRGGTVALAHAADVSDIDQVRALAARVHETTDALDAVMNVAGIATWGTVSTLRHEQWRTVVDVNLMGPIHVIESFVPQMVSARRGGYLVNVSSAAGLIGLPWHAAYSASKFGLRGVSEVLRFDLARNGISVTLVCPGGVDTPLTETVDIANLDKDTAAFRAVQAHFRKRAVSADEAAKAIVHGMFARRYLVYTSQDIRVIHAIQRYVPPLYVLIMRAFNRAADAVATRAAAQSHSMAPR